MCVAVQPEPKRHGIVYFTLIFMAAQAEALRLSNSARSEAPPDCPFCWAFEGGSTAMDLEPVYSSVDPNQITPGSRFAPCDWLDEANGNLYIFGGLNLILNLLYADLWKFSLSSRSWTFLKGTTTSYFAGSYGTMNVSSPDNLPAARYNCMSWFDPVDRRLYMYGGAGPGGFLSDTWYFSLDSMEFVWIGGPTIANQPGSYGEKRVFNASNTPPPRHGSAAGFDPASRRLLMFGGGLHPCYDQKHFNDLWIFDLQLQQWAWWHGSDQYNQTGIYGELGVENPENTPGARSFITRLFPKMENNVTSFFMYGGVGYGNVSNNFGGLDDIWSFSFANSSWTWRSGARRASTSASSLGATPGGMGNNGPGWLDPEMNGFYLFSGSVEGWCLNQKGRTDVWFYNWHTFSWRFIQGTNATVAPPPNYGELGVPSNTSYPSERGGITQWVDTARRALYLYSGGRHASLWSVRLPALPSQPAEPPQQVPEAAPFVNETAVPASAPTDVASADQMIAVRAAVGVVVALALSAAIGIVIVFVIRRRNSKGRDPGGAVTPNPEQDRSIGTNYTDIAAEMAEIPALEDDTFKPEWMIPFNELTFKKKIGQGAYGIVYRGIWNASEVAIKQSLVLCVDDALEDFKREVLLMLSLRPHPNCVQMYGICVDNTNVYAVMELCSGGSVHTLLKAGNVPLDRKLKIIAGTAAGIRHLHKSGIVHRDLAARNILLGSGDVAKVSDFGMSRMVDQFQREGTTNSDVGPIRWMAPESIEKRKYSYKSDVWSWANTVVEILTEKVPYSKMSTAEVLSAVSTRGTPPPLGSAPCPPWLLALLQKCWSISPKDRPSMDEISDVLVKNML